MQTKDFLKFFPESVFQTFLDNPNIKSDERPTIFYEYDETKFQALNKKGFGIYFTANGFKNGRKLENLTKLHAVYADLDIAKEGDGTTEEQKNKLKNTLTAALIFYCNPSFIIETKNGLQPLWLIQADLTEENKILYTKVIQGITEWSKQLGCKGDKVKDFSRVLRLPNFYHLKNLKSVFKCTVQEYSDKIYSLQNLASCFPYTELLPPEPTNTRLEFKKGYEAQQIDFIDIQEIVIRAYAYRGDKAEFDNQKRLVLNGRLTGTHQGKTGDGQFIASNSHDPIKGNKISVVSEILGITTKDAFLWIIEEFKLKQKKAQDEIKKIEEPVKKAERKQFYSWGTQELTESFAPIKSDTYAIVGAGFGTGKTTFCLNIAIENAKIGHRVLYLSLEMSTDEILDYLSRKASKTTIPEEIYNRVPDYKQKLYEERMAEIKNLKNFTLKGVKGGTKIDWDVLVELMKGEWDMIIVDNFNLIVRSGSMNQYDHEGELSSKFLAYAVQHQTPIIVVHHYSKGGARETVKSGYSLAGNAKTMNDAQRIVLLERKRFETDDNPSPKERAELKVILDKGRGYDGHITKFIYWVDGFFYDRFPEIEQPKTIAWWNNT
jgi:hypothetical protein